MENKKERDVLDSSLCGNLPNYFMRYFTYISIYEWAKYEK